MLVEFRLTNFRSYRDEQTFSLVAGSGKELPQNLADADMLGKSTKLLKSAVIYGANASGKSNLFHAFEFLKYFVLNSANQPPGSGIDVQPFLLDADSKNAPTEFEITFINYDDVPYRYGFAADHERVIAEWLIAYPHRLPQTWFERAVDPGPGEAPWYFGPSLKGEKVKLQELTRPDVLFLSVAAQFNHGQLLPIYDWFRRAITIVSSTAEWKLFEQRAFRSIHTDDKLRQKVINLLRLADLGIDGIETDISSSTVPSQGYNTFSGEEVELLQSIQKAIETTVTEKGRILETIIPSLLHVSGRPDAAPVPLPLESQSLGTRRMLVGAIPILRALENGTILIVDEIDSSLHPILVKELVRLFSNPELNRHDAQLIFNTHDVTLLDNDLLRRDQIWFTEKAADGSTDLYSLQEFKPRKSEALGKNYLQGRYGAIPVITGIFKDLVPDG